MRVNECFSKCQWGRGMMLALQMALTLTRPKTSSHLTARLCHYDNTILNQLCNWALASVQVS